MLFFCDLSVDLVIIVTGLQLHTSGGSRGRVRVQLPDSLLDEAVLQSVTPVSD